MNHLSELSVGVDVGGTKVAAAAVTGTTIVETHERPTVLTSGTLLVDEIERAARVVIDGHVFRGATGLGAELGHVVIDANGPECPGNCPNRGCMEALCSGLAL